MLRPPCIAIGALLLLAAPGAALAERSAEKILECVRTSRPSGNTLETVRMVQRDRTGAEIERRASIYNGSTRDGYRALWVRFLSPSELMGSSALMAVVDQKVQVFITLAGVPQPRRLRGAESSSGLFGTDLSVEDFITLYGLNRPGKAEVLGDGSIDDRPTDIIRTMPERPEDSAYAYVVSNVDRESCTVVRAEMYEEAPDPRKTLTVATESLEKILDGWLPRRVDVADARDGTQTTLAVETVFFGTDVVELPFSVGAESDE